MKKKKAIISKDIEAVAKEIAMSPEIETKLRQALPGWVPDKEDTGTAMMQTGMEFLILVEHLLQRYHGMSEEETIRLEQELKEHLPILHTIEMKGLSILSDRDMATVGNIAEIRRQRLEEYRTGIFLPQKKGIKKLK